MSDGAVLRGEGLIDNRSTDDDRTIKSAQLEPSAHIYAKAYEALAAADKIVFCPGDFWTSLIPNLLVDGFADAVRESNALTVMVVNIMTKKAETHGYTSSMFVTELCRYLNRPSIDVALCNATPIPSSVQGTYSQELAYPVELGNNSSATNWVDGPFADWSGNIVRHNDKAVSQIADL